MKILALLVVLLIGLVGISSATDYYVSPTGNDLNDGLSIGNAWLNISVSDDKLYAGDTLYVVNGTYYQQGIQFVREGNSTHPIKVVAYNGTPVLNGLNFVGIGAYLNVDWSIIDGLTFTRFDYGAWSGYAAQRDNQTIINSTFYNMTTDGIKLYKDVNNILIENCTVYDVGDHGIHVYNQQSVPNTIAIGVRIINNTIYNAPHNLIDFHTRVSNSIVEGNELYFSDDYSGLKQVGLYLHNGDTDNIIIQNNIFHDQPRPLEILNSKNITVVNNTFYNINGRSIMLGDAGTTYESTDFGVFDSTFENNTFNNTAGILFYTSLSATFDNLTFENNHFTNISSYFIWFDNNITISNVEILDTTPLSDTHQGSRLLDYISDVTFTNFFYNYSSNFIMNIDDGTQTTYLPNVSSIPVNIISDANILTYNISATPHTNSTTVVMNAYDITLPIGTVLINFTANSTDGTNVTFIVNDLQYSNNYQVKKDDVDFTTVIANSSGSITFYNQDWSEHTFTITDVSIPPEPIVIGLLVRCHSNGTYTYPIREKQIGDISSNLRVSW